MFQPEPSVCNTTLTPVHRLLSEFDPLLRLLFYARVLPPKRQQGLAETTSVAEGGAADDAHGRLLSLLGRHGGMVDRFLHHQAGPKTFHTQGFGISSGTYSFPLILPIGINSNTTFLSTSK